MRLDLFELETAMDLGDGGGGAPAAESFDAPAAEVAAPEGEASSAAPEAPAAESWQGPSQDEWTQTQQALAEARDFINMVQGAQIPDAPAEPEPLPEYDPFDAESVAAYNEARDARLLAEFQRMLAPVTDTYENQRAQQWAEQTFEKLGVPEEDLWREGVLFTSAGFQQFDAQGRAVVRPEQAAAQGYEFLNRFAEHIRAQDRAQQAQHQQQQTEALANRAGAPVIPTGGSGGEGVPENIDELGLARRIRERDAALGA